MTQWGLDTLFNPAKRHMDEEKRRLQSTREEVGDNSGGKRIDLESGRVVIHRSAEGAAEDDADPAPTDGGAATDGVAPTDGVARAARAEPDDDALTPAQRRARERRRRTAR